MMTDKKSDFYNGLVASINKDWLTRSFMKLDETTLLMSKIKNNAYQDESLNEQLELNFKSYFFYVQFLSYIKQVLYFKKVHLVESAKKKQCNTYDVDNIASSSSSSQKISDDLLAGLTNKNKYILKLLYEEGYSQKEVAQQLSISEAAVSKTKKRSFSKLKEKNERLQ